MQGWYDGKGLIYYRPINKSALCRSTSPAFSFVFNGVASLLARTLARILYIRDLKIRGRRRQR